MVEAIRILRREHGNIAKLLNVLERQLEIFDAGEMPDYDIIRASVEYFLAFPDQCHHPKEDIVFRQLKARDPAAAEAVGNLESAHEKLAGLTRHFAEAVASLLGDAEMPRESFDRAVRDFIERERHHMAVEEEKFFPVALKVLSEEDWAKVDAQVIDREDPLFGAEVEQRFEDLRERILRWEREDLRLQRS